MVKKINEVQIADISIDYIDDPLLLVRDPGESSEDLRALGISMKNFGQINPVIVRKKGDRFELVAGHRRTRSARLVGMATIKAEVREMSDTEAALVRWSENHDRLQNNAVEEARFIREMMSLCDLNQADLALKIGKSSAYVCQKLALLDGPIEIQRAVQDHLISFDVARELLLCPTTKSKLQLLQYATDGGASARVVRRWREDAQLQAQLNIEGETNVEQPDKQPFYPERQVIFCEACRNTFYLTEVTYLRVCHTCEGIIKANPEVKR